MSGYQQCSHIVNKNPERYRGVLVSHEGRKELRVKTNDLFSKQADWNGLINGFTAEIGRFWAVVPLQTRGRPWPREREGPTSAAQWEGWSGAEGRQGTTAQEPPKPPRATKATKSHQKPPKATKYNKGAQPLLSARELQGKVYLCIRHEDNSIIDPFTAIRGVDTLRAGLGDHAGRPRRCGTSHGKPLQ